MEEVYTYQNITQANYTTPGFYHIVKNLNRLIAPIISFDSAASPQIQITFDNDIWLSLAYVTQSDLEPEYYGGMVALRILPSTNTQVAQLSVTEYLYPVAVSRLG